MTNYDFNFFKVQIFTAIQWNKKIQMNKKII